jgi:hypothetical protein
VPPDDPSSVYAGQVADIIAATPRDSTYRPTTPLELFVRNRRAISSIDQLEPEELLQLSKLCGDGLARAITDGIDGMPMDLEAAHVVDDAGALRYRLYGSNYGVVYLMSASGLECIAFAAQHDLEHWNLDQRAIFWAMDRAMSRRDHGFQQPMEFCWWRENCWDEIRDVEPGTVNSEPYIRQMLAGRN